MTFFTCNRYFVEFFAAKLRFIIFGEKKNISASESGCEKFRDYTRKNLAESPGLPSRKAPEGELLRELELGAFEFKDAQRVAADEDAIFLDENGGSFEPHAFRCVELVGGLTISVFVEA
jgi:hypothetical protein